jgi:methyl-accepting chemotaxis protein
MPQHATHATAPRRLISKFSVRARIVAIALIPVVGFIANALTFMGGEHEVSAALDSLRQATAAADASREFKGAVVTIQAAARSFADHPRPGYLQILSAAQQEANTQFARIRQFSVGQDRSNIDAIERTFARMHGNFQELNKEYQRLGVDGESGIRARMRDASGEVERVISLDMSWLPENVSHQLIVSLLAMRRYEASYMLDRGFADRSAFSAEVSKFTKIIEGVVAADVLKGQILQTVRSYAEAFEAWIAANAEITSRVAGIDSDAEFLIRSADANVSRSNEQRAQASAALNRSQQHTRNTIIQVGLATVILGLAFGLWIGQTITRPLRGLAGVMKRLADGDTSAPIPATRAKDELGAMARAVVVFRDNMIERERLTATQIESARARELRGEAIAVTIARFETSVDAALSKVREAAFQLESASGHLNSAADRVSAESQTAERRVGLASGNVTTAASSVEELAASIGGIAQQATRSTEVARGRPPGGRRGPADRGHDGLAWRCRDPHRRGDRVDPGDCRTDQPARAQRDDRSGPRGRSRTRLRGGRRRGQVARRTDLEGHRRDRRSGRRHPVGCGGCRARYRAGQHYHRGNVRHRVDRRGHGRGAEPGGVQHRRGRVPGVRRGTFGRRGHEPRRRRD